LQRNLIYTGITRGKRLLVLIGQKKASGIAVRNDRPQRRYSGLLASLRSDRREASEMLLALTAPAPVPTASTKQEHNQDDNQNRF
jgi:hypothetical protein